METPKKKVLVVEDDQGVREVIKVILEKRGYEVLDAENGVQALPKVGNADVVLLDLFLPVMSGKEFLETIRNKGNYIPVVIMSASVKAEEAVSDFKKYQIVDFVPKPFKTEELVEKVEKGISIAEDLKTVDNATNRLKSFIDRQTGKDNQPRFG